MSDAQQPIGLSNPDVGGRLPGEVLRAAREAQGLSIDHLAANLKVAPAKLIALEEGRLQALPDASFARALAQAVCRALKIDPAPVLAGLPAARVAVLGQEKPPLNQPFKEARLASRMFDGASAGSLAALLRPQWLGPLVLLLAAAVIYALPETFEWPRWQAQPASSTPSAAEQTADGLLPPPVASDAEVASAVPPASQAMVASDATPALAQPVALPEAAASSPLTPSVADPASPIAEGPVSIAVTEDAWIEVVDGDGTKRLSRIVRSGESMSMGGVPPWRVRIGHVGGVQVSFHGQPVDLTPFTRNNVARLELK